MVTKVKCPTCQSEIEWGPQSPFRPFCSKRCQLIDLGEWADEQKRIPGRSTRICCPIRNRAIPGNKHFTIKKGPSGPFSLVSIPFQASEACNRATMGPLASGKWYSCSEASGTQRHSCPSLPKGSPWKRVTFQISSKTCLSG